MTVLRHSLLLSSSQLCTEVANLSEQDTTVQDSTLTLPPSLFVAALHRGRKGRHDSTRQPCGLGLLRAQAVEQPLIISYISLLHRGLSGCFCMRGTGKGQKQKKMMMVFSHTRRLSSSQESVQAVNVTEQQESFGMFRGTKLMF